MNRAAARFAIITGVAAVMSLPSAAHADSLTVTDERGDIFPGPEISDIVSATVAYGKRRITIGVEHATWNTQWNRQRAATGGKLTFSKGGTYIVQPNAGARGSVLSTMKQFRACVAGRGTGTPCRTIRCSGWSYSVDRANRRTSVSIPVRCFPKSSGKVKVMPFHQIVSYDSPSVIDPIATTPWIRRG